MILLFHGTGDHNGKDENWMKWVAEIMRHHGETVICVAGVASDQQDEIYRELLPLYTNLQLPSVNPTPRVANASLHAALESAGGELVRALQVNANGEEQASSDLILHKRQEKGPTTSGIKIRVALASLAALAYWRRTPSHNRRPIRIIGHSRGGCVAIGVHNVLTYFGIPCDRTLTLDPCHGINKDLGLRIMLSLMGAIPVMPFIPSIQKSYFHKVWGGTLQNIPARKGVGKDWAGFAVYRPPITVGHGGVANVTNHPTMQRVKHGHMGKLQRLNGNEAAKNQRRQELREMFQDIVDAPGLIAGNAQAHLNKFFNLSTTRDSDYQEKLFIQSKVIEILTT